MNIIRWSFNTSWSLNTGGLFIQETVVSTMEKLLNAARTLVNSRKAILTTVIGTGGYVTYTDTQRYPRMTHQFKHGNILTPLKENDYKTVYHKRPQLEDKLRYILGPEFTNEYYLVKGEVGTGKSRTIVQIVQEMIEDSYQHHHEGAPIYVLVTQQKDFANSLGKAVGFNFDEHINFKFFLRYIMKIDKFPQRDDHHKLNRVLHAIETAAYDYMRKHGRPLVLVIDGANTLTEHLPGALEKIQEKAKLWADSNICKVVFVSNEESTENILKINCSCWSRAGAPVNVGDITKEEALKYLQNDRYLEDKKPPDKCMILSAAEEIYNLVGGRMNDLIILKRDFIRGVPFGQTAEYMKDKEREKFVRISNDPENWKAVQLLMKAPSMEMYLSDLVKLTNARCIDVLAKENVIKLCRVQAGVKVKFESRLTENTVEEMFVKYSTK